jgi:subtilisin-like proprotein convertase family protein
MDPAGLPADGIDELSNGLIWNQFTDVFASAAALAIPDNNPIGGFSEIVVGDVGLAQKLTVSVELANSDISAVQVSLYDAANQEYVLYNKGGKKGDGIKTSYPTPTKTVSGDLTYWVGKNPKGTWRLKVIDTAFLNNTTDGQVVAWSVNLQTLSSKKIQVKGDLIVDGATTIGGDLKVTGKITSGSGGSYYIAPAGTSFYRWNVWNNHDYQWDWFWANNTWFTGGVNPSSWADSNYHAAHLSADKNLLRTLFNQKAWAGKMALVYAQNYVMVNTSTDGKFVGAMFRIKNTTASNINWTLRYFYTSYGSWGMAAGCALNGSDVFSTTGNCYPGQCSNDITVTIPANRISTFICTNGSSRPYSPSSWWMHSTLMMAFGNDSLNLPAGLSYIDDFDTATGGWEQ